MGISINSYTRRRVLYGLQIFLASSFIPHYVSAASKYIFSKEKYKIISGYRDSLGVNNFGLFRLDGRKIFSIKLDWRSHGSDFISFNKEIVVYPRRPGNKILIIDANNGLLKRIIQAKKGYHYYGHGAFSLLDRYLYVTENKFNYSDSRSGIIVIYDTQKNYKRIVEYKSYGIGPHEIKVSSDKKFNV